MQNNWNHRSHSFVKNDLTCKCLLSDPYLQIPIPPANSAKGCSYNIIMNLLCKVIRIFRTSDCSPLVLCCSCELEPGYLSNNPRRRCCCTSRDDCWIMVFRLSLAHARASSCTGFAWFYSLACLCVAFRRWTTAISRVDKHTIIPLV